MATFLLDMGWLIGIIAGYGLLVANENGILRID
jgi:hypothetical protein